MDAPQAKKLLRSLGTDYFLELAKGRIRGHSAVHQTFRNADVSTTAETIWMNDGSYTFRDTARTLTVSCDNGNDASGGSGAGKLHIEGLDENYNEIEEIIAINGSAVVSTVNEYLRINDPHVVSAATDRTFNVSSIYVGASTVTNGVPAEVWDVIAPGRNTAETAIRTIPAGKYGFLIKSNIFSSSNKEVDVDIFMNHPGHPIIVHENLKAIQGPVEHKIFIPHRMEPKTDLEFKAKLVSGAADTISGDFEIILVDSGYIDNLDG